MDQVLSSTMTSKLMMKVITPQVAFTFGHSITSIDPKQTVSNFRYLERLSMKHQDSVCSRIFQAAVMFSARQIKRLLTECDRGDWPFLLVR